MSQDSAARSGEAQPEWVDVAHPDRLTGRLDSRLQAATLDRLRATTRLRRRLADMMIAPSPPDAVPTASGGAGSEIELMKAIERHPPANLAKLSGAVWHGGALKRIISGKAVIALTEAIGPEAYAFGIANTDLSVAPETAAATPEDLVRAIEDDGLRCLGLALLRLPSKTRSAVLLRLPPGSLAESVSVASPGAAEAAAIMARVLIHLEALPAGAEHHAA